MANEKIHVFEKAGLGKAPFRFVGFHVSVYQACQGAPIQPGTCCDYCGTAIMNVCTIQSADGKTFKVGCDCVEKTGDAGLRAKTDAAKKKHQTQLRHMREAEKLALVKEALENPERRAEWAKLPHPWDWKAAAGETLLTQYDWLWQHSGTSGRIRLGKTLGVI